MLAVTPLNCCASDAPPQVCYYRDKVSINKFQIAKVSTEGGVSISEPFALDMRWDYKMFAQPTKWAVGAW